MTWLAGNFTPVWIVYFILLAVVGIEANIELTAPGGSKRTIDLAGWGANRAEDQLGQCEPGSEVDVTVLQHVGTILDVACKER